MQTVPSVCVLSGATEPPLTEDISKSISQPCLKEVVPFSVALFFVRFPPPDIYIEILFVP